MKLFNLLYACIFLARTIIAYEPDVNSIETPKGQVKIVPFEDSTTLFISSLHELRISHDNGNKWTKVVSDDDRIIDLIIDPNYGHSRAFVKLGNELMITEDQGDNWSKKKISVFDEKLRLKSVKSNPFIKNSIILRLADNTEKTLQEFISLDGGKSFKLLEAGHPLAYCSFLALDRYTNFEKNDNDIICQLPYKTSMEEGGMYISNNKGKSFKIVDVGENKEIKNFMVTKSYILADVLQDRHNKNSASDIFVSTDGVNFQKSYLPTRINAVKMLQPHEIEGRRIIIPFVVGSGSEDRKKEGQPSSAIISSSDGLKFSLIEDEDDVDDVASRYFPVEFLKGTIFKVTFQHDEPLTRYSISTDNGNSWVRPMYSDPEGKNPIKCPGQEESCPLNLLYHMTPHSTTAGILLSMGFIQPNDIQTFVSRDGGVNWELASKSAGLTSAGDLGNVLVICPINPEDDNDPQSEIYFSLDQGKTWQEYELESSFIPVDLINTTPDGSGSRFILSGYLVVDGAPDPTKPVAYIIDFSKAHGGKKCGKNDYEIFSLSDGECINGVKYTYKRRKQDARCFAGTVFEDLAFETEDCLECTDADYECNLQFKKDDNGQCVVDVNWLEATGNCPDGEKEFPVKRLISDNKCKSPQKINKAPVSCRNTPNNDGDNQKPKKPQIGTGKIEAIRNTFNGKVAFYQYFDSEEDESLVLVTNHGKAYTSEDSGKTFRAFPSGKIREVVFNKYFNSSAYLFDTDGNIHITHDRGHTFKTVKLPASLQLSLPLNFHAKDPNTFIYYGGQNCDSLFSRNCHVVSYITRDGGNTFSELLPNAIHCEFVGSSLRDSENDDLIFCQVRDQNSDNKMQRSLVSSTDYFNSAPKVIFETILGYLTTGEYVIIAVPDKKRGELDAYVTMDGVEFAEALLPYDMDFSAQEAFTVLGSSTGAIFMHFTTSKSRNFAFGSLLKSNTNGTSYVKLHSNVNRNAEGFVDFEKIQGLEGIILTNIVKNADKADAEEDKKIKTKITFNDGADWSYLTPPKYDSDGKKYECNSKSLEKCSLNLHGYTERKDYRDTLSSGSALGMLIGVGNVGESLTSRDEASTFLTIDGGKTWTEVKKGSHQYEFGDHGGVLVLAPEGKKTDSISYSIDFGKTWSEYKFADEPVFVSDIVTVPRDSALRFILITESSVGRSAESATVTIDFSGLFERQCILDHKNEKFDDFDYFTVGNSDSECLFGHQAKYLRKNKPECFVGAVGLDQFTVIAKNCTCTRADFECDYNYEKMYDGTCRLVEGLSSGDASAVCKKNPDLVEYFESTGYRKIPLSTCHGGLKLDGRNEPMACPGKEAEFREKYGIKGSSFFMTFTVMFVFFCLAGWFIYDRGIRRNGGFARFGEIRLGDDQLIEENNTDKIVNAVIRFGVASFGVMSTGFNFVKRAANIGVNRFSGRINGRNRPSYSNLMHDDFLDEADDLLAGHDADANDLSSFMDDDSNFDIENEGGMYPSEDGYHDEVDDSDIPDPVKPSSGVDDNDNEN